jgi:hypothetical protein
LDAGNTRAQAPYPPPRRNETVELQTADGRWHIGWRSYSITGGSRYFTRSLDAPRPSRGITSRWDIEGVVEIYPVAWRHHVKARVTPPNDPLAWREVAELLRRAMLYDGTVDRPLVVNLESSWDSDLHNDGLALVDQINLEIFEKFIPENFDVDNYTVVMDWFCALDRKAISKGYCSRAQSAIALRAYGWTFDRIGGEFDVSRQRAQVVYRSAVERVWQMALADQTTIRRLPRNLWKVD